MVLKVYSVFDSAVKTYSKPFMCSGRGEAVRSWVDAVSDDKLPFKAHPHDYCLFELGEFNQVDGQMTSHRVPEKIGLASEFVRSSEV